MAKLLFGTILLALIIAVPVTTTAGVNSYTGSPPPILFPAPPELIVIPETNVYVVPEVQEDIFFYNGWWWRQWGGRWYRSRHYSSGWVYYQGVPSFYVGIPSSWRDYYKDRRWRGHQWNYQRIPYQQLERKWSSWEMSKYWEKEQPWRVQGSWPDRPAPMCLKISIWHW